MNAPDGRRRWGWLAVALAAVAAWTCQARDAETIGSADNPLVVLLSPAHAGTGEARAALEARLERASGLALELRVAPSGEAAVQMAGSPQIDAGLLPLFDYLFAHQEYGVQAALQVVRHGGATAYRGELAVRADSGLQSLADLQGRPVAFVDPYSTSGFLLPAKLLADAGVTPVVLLAGTHAAALEWLRNGTADAAAVYVGSAAGDASLRVLATTGEVPNEPLFFRSGLEAGLRQRLTDALVAVASQPDGAGALSELADISGFRPIADGDYRAVHDTIESTGRSVEDLVPAGWLIRNQNQRRLSDYAP